MSLVKINNRTRSNAPYFNNVFDSLFNEAVNKNYGLSKVPGVNILEDAANFKIELAAPGLNKEDFKISLKKDVLEIWAAPATNETTTQPTYARKEFDYSSFSRSFVLPESVDANRIEATYNNGVLIVSLGKKELEKEQNKEIEVK